MTNPEVLYEAQQEWNRRQQAKLAEQRADVLKTYVSKIDEKKLHAVLGNPKGDVTLVEFFDYNCGFCRRAIKDIDALVDNDPNLRVVVMELPVIREESVGAAQVSIALNRIAGQVPRLPRQAARRPVARDPRQSARGRDRGRRRPQEARGRDGRAGGRGDPARIETARRRSRRRGDADLRDRRGRGAEHARDRRRPQGPGRGASEVRQGHVLSRSPAVRRARPPAVPRSLRTLLFRNRLGSGRVFPIRRRSAASGRARPGGQPGRLSEASLEPSGLHPQWTEPQSARAARAGGLWLGDARRRRGSFARRRRRTRPVGRVPPVQS
ncbi:thioredoxin domain-containing protein [Chenggangzhangella methanolivorans]|uniref:Thioredoxin domain-containing protein n=1 Tax=Chenggangzhangella methanolivorans TaxID=1437009 RepID=A0A9E6R922_9HYPH|nr:thioredoxin domain-containing protein [Chenggangzhangella methanolivorans]